MNEWTKVEACPLCGGEGKPVHINVGPLMKIERKLSLECGILTRYDLCDECSLHYQNPTPLPVAKKEIANDYFLIGMEELNSRILSNKDVHSSYLKNYFDETPLYVILGHATEHTLTDPSSFAIQHNEKKLPPVPLYILQRYLSFTPNPERVLRNIHKQIDPNSFVYIVESVMQDTISFDLSRSFVFTAKSLGILVQKAGFEIHGINTDISSELAVLIKKAP